MRPLTFLVALAAAASAAAEEAPAPVRIEHRALECVSAEAFPRITAKLTPAEDVTLAWVYFRGKPDTGWYSVRLRPDDQGYSATLPRPKWLKRFSYYIEVSDRQAGTTRGEEITTEVEKNDAGCGQRLGDSVGSAEGLIIDKPVGASLKSPLVPRGFSSRGTIGGDAGMVELAPGRTRLLTVGILGGAVAGIMSQLKGDTEPYSPNEPPPSNFHIFLRDSSPPPGGEVSLSQRMSMVLEIAGTASESEPVRNVRVEFIVEPFTCASLYGPVTGPLPQSVRIEGFLERFNFPPAECRPPYTTHNVRATVLGDGYAPIRNAAPVALGTHYTITP
ncbi:MAG TPA: hypothetical protein VFM88_21165 [Vicinamibacteria bacterium]|nr:hypothetical protein [Vicinamibacteria bacterium]